MSRFLQERFQAFAAYVPGEQPTGRQFIKLNTNESPYPPSPAVLASVTQEQVARLNLYPPTDGIELMRGLAQTYGVDAENVIIGNGSDEVLAFAFLAFCGGGVVFPDITYGFYPVYARLYDLPFERIPLRDDFTIAPEDYFNAGRTIVIANPNAPSGIALSLRDIEEIVKRNHDNVVLIDEAYVDFGAESAIPLVKKYDNLIVCHTYSKSRSMAGARLGYAIAQKPLIEDLNKMRFSFNPYSVNSLTQLMGLAALQDSGYYKDCHREIIKTREYTQTRLRELGFLATDSRANFVFAKHSDVPGSALYKKLRERGILVRHFDAPRISDYLRITVGTPEQMQTLVDAFEDILK